MKKWYHNAKTGEIESYNQENTLTGFPRDTLMAYGGYLTAGISSKEKAIEWAKEWGCCSKCKCSRHANEKGNCNFCGTKIEFVERKEL